MSARGLAGRRNLTREAMVLEDSLLGECDVRFHVGASGEGVSQSRGNIKIEVLTCPAGGDFH